MLYLIVVPTSKVHWVMKIKILALTGIRSEYDILYPVLKELKKNFLIGLVVTGAHLKKKFGFTFKEILKDKLKIIGKIDNLKNGNKLHHRAMGIPKQVKDLINVSIRFNPTYFLVVGDREESIVAAIVATYLQIPLIHIGGGDRVVGNIDDHVRHAVSKLAHLHFVNNIESKKRLLKMGEQNFRVFNVGNPGIDRFRIEPWINLDKLSKKLNFKIKKNEKFLILILHPLSSEYKESGNQMSITINAIKKLNIKTFIIFPNSDIGSNHIINKINSLKNKNFCIKKNIPRNLFINLLRYASCLVGNSSLGIIESPYLKLPVVNIGNRQKKRFAQDNVLFTSFNERMIVKSIKKCLFDKKFLKKIFLLKNPYGNGYASKKILKILNTIKIDKKFLLKDIKY